MMKNEMTNVNNILDFISNPKGYCPKKTIELLGCKELSNLRFYVEDNIIYLNLDDVARGLGFTQVKNGSTYVRYERVEGFLKDFGFSPQVGKDTYIPENMFYLLAMKANNEVAVSFQMLIANKILPTIRKTGGYVVPGREQEFINNNPAILAELQQLRTAVEIMQAQLMATPDAYVQNTWKKNISQPLARKVQEKYAVGDKDAYKMIYVEMQSQFGFDGISAIMAYHHKYNLAQNVHVSAITAIADDKVYQGYFSQAANRLLAEHEVTPDDLITTVAKALGYSKPCATVYSKIYSRMNTARGWKHMLTRHKCHTKKELIENNKEYGALYVKCCNEILDEHR